jgi:F-type H+-transporting ATPase subunit delta
VPDATHAGPLARRYAAAYFDLAGEAGQIPQWRGDLAAAADALAVPDVRDALENPRLSPARRTALAMELLEGTLPQLRNLVRLLVDRRRVRLLPGVLAYYDTLADRASGVVRADVTTAVEVDAQLREAIERALSQRFGKDVQTQVRKDPAIVGGLVIKVGDRVIDDSVRTHLQQLQAALA